MDVNEQLWQANYPQGIPFTIDPDQYTSLPHLFDECCQQFWALPALRCLNTELSFADLDRLSQHAAHYFREILHLKKGERVALMLPNILTYPILAMAILRAGLVLVNVNPFYSSRELTHQLKDAGASVLIVLRQFAHTAEAALPNLPDLKHIYIAEVGDLMPLWKQYLLKTVFALRGAVRPWHIPQAKFLAKIFNSSVPKTLPAVLLSGSDIAVLQYTGGTTGIAKGAILTHRNLIANVLQAEAWVQNTLEVGKETIITALPLYHIFAFTANWLLFMKLGGLSVLIPNPRDIKSFVRLLSKQSFTVMTGVNTLFNALMNHPKFSEIPFKMKFSLAGGMKLQETVAQRWKALTGTAILEAYGLTETSPAVCINPLNLSEYNGSIGLPLPSTEIRICDEENRVVGVGESGELHVRGPQVMKGYWQKLEETELVLTKDGWLRTGDIAQVDERGFCYLIDRKKDMILVSGFNVYPNEVENEIAAHPSVLEVGVIGVPDEHSGEAVKACIVIKATTPALTEQELRMFLSKRLAPYKIPKIIEFRTELPKSTVGKVLRRALRDDDAPATTGVG